jgi:endonuclease YncB( thermonuclease family)
VVPLALLALALLGAALGGCGRSRWQLATSPAERASWPGPPAGTVAARVERVVDGDTFEATVAGRREHVRMIGLDTPETVAPGRPVAPYGPQASAFAKHWLTGTTVRMAGDAEPRDHYGRLLAYAWLGDGTFWNALLLAEGYAKPLTIRPNDAFTQPFARLAAAARAARRGLWAGGRRAAHAAAGPVRGTSPAAPGAGAPPLDQNVRTEEGRDRPCRALTRMASPAGSPTRRAPCWGPRASATSASTSWPTPS